MPWISRADLNALQQALVEERTRATVLAQQAGTHATQTAFLIGQINQLNKERVIMVRQITRLEIPLPTLAAVPEKAVISQQDIIDAMGSGMFEDMGDAEAKAAGVGWNPSGEVEYVGPRPVKGNGHV